MFIKNTVDISEQNICNGKHSKNKYIHNYNKLFCKNIENIGQNYNNELKCLLVHIRQMKRWNWEAPSMVRPALCIISYILCSPMLLTVRQTCLSLFLLFVCLCYYDTDAFLFCPSVLVRGFIAAKRHHNFGNSYKETI